MNLPAPFTRRGEHCAIALEHAEVLFTTRRGGVSGGPYASLNLGRFTDDDPQAVEDNRRALEGKVARRLAYGRQVHGVHVRAIPADGDDRTEVQPPDPPEPCNRRTRRGRPRSPHSSMARLRARSPPGADHSPRVRGAPALRAR